MKGIILGIAMLFLAASGFAQQTVTITATKDNTLYEDADGLTSNGAGSFLFVGQVGAGGGNKNRRTVLKFDLAGKLPANAIITGAKLKMNMSKSNTGASDISVYRLLGDWGEGTSDAGGNEGGGAAASLNDATWKHRFFDTQNWSVLGGDFVPIVSAKTSVNSTGSYQWSDTLMWADVLVWFSNPSLNFGWILIGNESAQSSKRFDSRNSTVAANRPQLIVNYTVPSSVIKISSMPEEFSLKQNYPNPFNPSTTISFSLKQSGLTTVKIFDLLGNEVSTLVNQDLSVGSHSVKFEGKDLSSGIYFYRLQSGVNTAIKKLMLLK